MKWMRGGFNWKQLSMWAVGGVGWYALVMVVVLATLMAVELGTTWAEDALVGRWAVSQLVGSVVQLGDEVTWEASARAEWKGGACEARRIPEATSFAAAPREGPFVVRGAAAKTSAARWDLAWLAEAPRGDLVVDYFMDARKTPSEGGLTPNGRAKLRDVATELGARNSTAKLATERLFRRFPDLLRDLPLDTLHAALGRGHFEPRRLGTTLTAPLFVGGRGRTDLHAEPIANVAFQLRGRKRWILFPPDCFTSLDPALSPDGRAYLASRLSPDQVAALPFASVLDLGPGDALFLPTFWWHRVDYGTTRQAYDHHDDDIAIGVSLFHLRPLQIMARRPERLLFTILLPNLLKELVGWKTQ